MEQNWIKNLVREEDQMESTGQISILQSKFSNEELQEHTIEFLKQLRTAFTQSISFFNQLKGYNGSIRIYGIADTDSDFMLFRNGYKLIFFMKQAGLIGIRFAHTEAMLPGQEEPPPRPTDFIKGVWKPYGELQWTNNDQPIRIDFLVRYYTTLFVKQSIR